MLTTKEKIQLEEHELYEDISDVEELRKQELLESGEKKKNGKAAAWCYLLLSLLFAGLAVIVQMWFDQITYPQRVIERAASSDPFVLNSTNFAAMTSEEAVVVTPYAFIGLFGFLFLLFLVLSIGAFRNKGKGQVRVTRDEYAPTFVPEGELTLSADEPLVGANKTKVKRIKDDLSKRSLTDKRKAQRILDPSINYEGLRKALTVSFAHHGLELNDESATKLLAAFAMSRIIFLKGVQKEDRKDCFDAIQGAFQMQGYLAPKGKSFANLLGSVSLIPEKRKSFLLGIESMYARKAEQFFEGYLETLNDPSEDHVYADGTFISMNLVVLAFLDEADDGKGIAPSVLLHSAFLKLPTSRLDNPYMGDEYSLRATSDEIRYLSSKETSIHYLSDSKLSSFDVVYEAAAKLGFTLPNDVENGFERAAATMLHFGMDEDRVSAFLLITSLLPYVMSAFKDEDLGKEGSFNEVFAREFVSSVEQKEIKEFYATFIVKDLKEEELQEDEAEEEAESETESETEPEAESETEPEEAPAKEEAPKVEEKAPADKKGKKAKKAAEESPKVEEKEAEEAPEEKEDATVEDEIAIDDEIKVVED